MLQATGELNITFGSMLDQVRSVAYRLSLEGVGRGDRVAIVGENHPNWAIAYLAILYRGAVATPLDPAAAINTLSSSLANSQSKLAFVSQPALDKFRETCVRLGQPIPVVILQQTSVIDAQDCFQNWANTPVANEFVIAPPELTTDDLALLIYTSGTTARPKGVLLTHGNITAQLTAVESLMKVTDHEVVLSILPLFHAYSQIINLWLAATVGARVVYLNQLGSADIEEALKSCGVTVLTGVPRVWYLFHKKIFDAVNAKSRPVRAVFKALLVINGLLRDHARINAGPIFFRPIHHAFGNEFHLAVSGGAMFDPGIAKDFHRLGFTILQGYGLTETAGAVTFTRFDDHVIGSVGDPLNGVEIKLLDPNSEGIGEILIRGRNVMRGYYRDADATREAFTSDGWFRSGDLGRFDDKGHLYIVGRKKEVIILSSGKNVFPEDVEAHYETSPLINEICVLGCYDSNSHFANVESLCAVVVPNFDFLKSHQITNPGEWIPWELEDLGRELPEYQRVHNFIVRTEPLPRTTTRKIRRFELEQELRVTGAEGWVKRNGHQPVLRTQDRELMQSPAWSIVTAIVANYIVDPPVLHPLLDLQVDLRLDSLVRIECITNVEKAIGIRFLPNEISSLLSLGDLVEMVHRKMRQNRVPFLLTQDATISVSPRFYWKDVLSNTGSLITELRPLLNRNGITVVLGYLILQVIYLAARVLFRMEVTGSSVLKQLNAPYLICPNHQSYIDPFLICSILPMRILSRIVHLGASRYFTGFVSSQLARLINVVPIDPDTHLLRAMCAGSAVLQNSRILNVYPEGRRSFDGKLGIFKKGAAIVATELNLPIVPVALDGTYRIWPRRSRSIRLAKVKVTFGAPIYPGEIRTANMTADEVYERVTAVTRERVGRLLEEMRNN